VNWAFERTGRKYNAGWDAVRKGLSNYPVDFHEAKGQEGVEPVVREVEHFHVVVAHGRSRHCGRRRRFLGAFLQILKHVAAAQTCYKMFVYLFVYLFGEKDKDRRKT
jgi:hypothetical protein